jgi:hypothetical protein
LGELPSQRNDRGSASRRGAMSASEPRPKLTARSRGTGNASGVGNRIQPR